MDENLQNNLPPEEEQSYLEEIFGPQVEEKKEQSNVAKSILNKVESGFKPPETIKPKIELADVPQSVDPTSSGDAKLDNIYNGFFNDHQAQGIADVSIENQPGYVPNEAYKDITNATSSEGVTKIQVEQKEKEVKPTPQPQSLKPGDGDFKIRTPEEEVIVIRESETSIEKFEKDEEEKEKQEYEKQEKEREAFLEKFEKEIDSEMTDLSIESREAQEYQIRSYIDGKEVTDEKKEEKKTDDKKEYIGGSKESSLFTHVASEWGKRMAANPSSSIPERIVGRDYIMSGSEEDIVDFFKQKNRITLNAQTKTVLPFSGMTLYLNSYTGSTLIKLLNTYTRWRAQYEYAINNNTDNSLDRMVSESYYKLRDLELKSIYEHVSSIKFAGQQKAIAKPSETDFFKMIKYPDLNTLYFAVFHSTNKTKRKKYTVTCKQEILNEQTKLYEECAGETEVALYDEELVFTIENPHITKEDFYQMIRDEYPPDKILGTTRIARTVIERLTETKTNIVQHVPSLWDYLETLRIMNDIIINDQNHIFSYDISLIDAQIPIEEWNQQKWDRAKLLKSYLYTKKIDFLYPIGEKEFEYRTISVDNNQRELIFDVMNSLSLDDAYLMTKGEQIRDLMTLKVLDYYIPSSKCSKCGKEWNPIRFDVRYNFFTRISEARSAQNQA